MECCSEDSYVNEKLELRNQYIPFEKGQKIISLFGITGSGKTTFLRKIIGIDPVHEKIPPTSTSRTTTYNFEVLVTNSNSYKACITFLSKKYIQSIIKTCLFDSIKKYSQSGDIIKAFNILFEDTTQTFRLKYIIGSPRDTESIYNKYSILITECAEEYTKNHDIFYAEKRDNYTDIEKFEIDEIIYEEVIKSRKFINAIKIIYSDVIKRVKSLIKNNIGEAKYDSEGDEWPMSYYFEETNRKKFIVRLHGFIGIQKNMWGHVLTPLIDNIRISGKFIPQWLNTCPNIAFIDGKGIGHTLQKQSIPAFYVEIFDISDFIIIIDEATKSMQQSTMDIISGIIKHGYLSKMSVCFSKFDLLKGDNFENDFDKKEHIQNSFRQLCDDIKNNKDEYSYNIVKDLEDAQYSKFFYFSYLNEEKADFKFIEEVKRFFKYIGLKNIVNERSRQADNNNALYVVNSKIPNSKSIPNQTKDYQAPIEKSKDEIYKKKFDAEYDERFLNALNKNINIWRAKLNLESNEAAKAEHWTRIKALCRRLGYFNMSSYDTLRPIDDFIDSIQNIFYIYCKNLSIKDSILQSLSKLNMQKTKLFIHTLQIDDWKIAYDRRGPGSTKIRSNDIDKILDLARKKSKKEILDASKEVIKNAL